MNFKTMKKTAWIVLVTAILLIIILLVIEKTIESSPEAEDKQKTIVIEEETEELKEIAEEEQETQESKTIVQKAKEYVKNILGEEEKDEEESKEQPEEESKEEPEIEETEEVEESKEETTEEENASVIIDEIFPPLERFFLDWNEDGVEDMVLIEIDGSHYVFPNYGTNESPVYNESYPYQE